MTSQRLAEPSNRVSLVLDRRDARSRRERPLSGWTSLRVDRETFARLQALQHSLPRLFAGTLAESDAEVLSMVELLELLSKAHAEQVTPAHCEPPPGPLSMARRIRTTGTA